MGKASRGKRDTAVDSRRDRVEAMRAADVRSQRRRNLLWLTACVVAIALVAGFTYWGTHRTTSERDELASQVSTYTGLTENHTTKAVTYPQTPPVGGDHDSTWLNCGIYDKAVRNENAVHSMEHGAVWITYDPSLSAEDVQKLRDQMPSSFVILSPYDGLPAPVVASAWGVQLKLTGVDDPRLKTFIDVYRQGSQTPEPGASCDGGTGTPIA